jgi:hypothetical protein
MATQKPQNTVGWHKSRQALVSLGTLVCFGVLLEQAITRMQHLMGCVAGHLLQALPWVFVQACDLLLADLPDLCHLFACYNLLATAGPVVQCALGVG